MKQAVIHMWDVHEIVLQANNQYENPYTDVTVWAELKGPGFEKRVFGFCSRLKQFVYFASVIAKQKGRMEIGNMLQGKPCVPVSERIPAHIPVGNGSRQFPMFDHIHRSEEHTSELQSR